MNQIWENAKKPNFGHQNVGRKNLFISFTSSSSKNLIYATILGNLKVN